MVHRSNKKCRCYLPRTRTCFKVFEIAPRRWCHNHPMSSPPFCLLCAAWAFCDISRTAGKSSGSVIDAFSTSGSDWHPCSQGRQCITEMLHTCRFLGICEAILGRVVERFKFSCTVFILESFLNQDTHVVRSTPPVKCSRSCATSPGLPLVFRKLSAPFHMRFLVR